MELVRTVIDSPLGPLTLVGSDAGLRAILWADETDHRLDDAVEGSHPVLEAAARQLSEYFAGDRRSFDVALDLVGTEFQVRCWLALATIPYGTTVSYAEQARRVGSPTAVRAVGSANGRNPISIILPCHRVIGSNGSLTGYAGGLAAKEYLLGLETGQLQLV